MSKADIEKYTSDDLSTEKLDELIKNRKSFQVVAVKDIGYMVNKLEGAIEKKDLKCRVYSEFRTAAIAGIAIPTPVTIFGGIAAAAGAAVHNIATFNPDYEIGKNYVKKSISVIYQRDN